LLLAKTNEDRTTSRKALFIVFFIFSTADYSFGLLVLISKLNFRNLKFSRILEILIIIL